MSTPPCTGLQYPSVCGLQWILPVAYLASVPLSLTFFLQWLEFHCGTHPFQVMMDLEEDSYLEGASCTCRCARLCLFYLWQTSLYPWVLLRTGLQMEPLLRGTLGPDDITEQACISRCQGAVLPLEVEIPSNRCPHPLSWFKVELFVAL